MELTKMRLDFKFYIEFMRCVILGKLSCLTEARRLPQAGTRWGKVLSDEVVVEITRTRLNSARDDTPAS